MGSNRAGEIADQRHDGAYQNGCKAGGEPQAALAQQFLAAVKQPKAKATDAGNQHCADDFQNDLSAASHDQIEDKQRDHGKDQHC